MSIKKVLVVNLPLLAVVLITLGVYSRIFDVYFQHEEWSAFTRTFVANNLSYVENLKRFFSPAVAHYVPLTLFIMHLYISILKLNATGYAFMSLSWHLLIGVVGYVLFFKIFRKSLLAIISTAFFLLNASSHQATTWLVADINTHLSTFFALTSIWLLISSKRVWASALLLFVSLLFKETALGMFLVLPIGIYLLVDDTSRWKFVSSIKIILSGFIYMLVRLAMLFTQRLNVEDRLVTETQSLVEVGLNLITFPAKMFSQSLVPIRLLLFIAKLLATFVPDFISGKDGTTARDIFIEGYMLQAVNWIIFTVGVVALFYLVRKIKNTRIVKVAVFGFLFFLINSFIYVFSPGRSGNIPVVDSRNLYFPLVGLSIFFGACAYLLYQRKQKLVALALLLIFSVHIYWLGKELNTLALAGRERSSILAQIQKEHPSLPSKVIFYTESDKSFYGFPEETKILPFQINFGYILLTYYWPVEDFPPEFADQTKFLYKVDAQEYKEVDGRGYGYFRNIENLEAVMLQDNLPLESLIAYRYNSQTHKVVDITEEIKTKLRGVNKN